MFPTAELPTAPIEWPTATSLAAPDSSPVVFVFAHAEQTDAFADMSAVRTQIEDQGHIVFVVTPEDGQNCTSVLDVARRVGASVFCDYGGVEAARFGAQGRIDVDVYAIDGRLTFQGDSDAADAIASAVRGDTED